MDIVITFLDGLERAVLQWALMVSLTLCALLIIAQIKGFFGKRKATEAHILLIKDLAQTQGELIAEKRGLEFISQKVDEWLEVTKAMAGLNK